MTGFCGHNTASAAGYCCYYGLKTVTQCPSKQTDHATANVARTAPRTSTRGTMSAGQVKRKPKIHQDQDSTHKMQFCSRSTYIVLSSSEVLQQLVSPLTQLGCLLLECISLSLGTSCITPSLPAQGTNILNTRFGANDRNGCTGCKQMTNHNLKNQQKWCATCKAYQ